MARADLEVIREWGALGTVDLAGAMTDEVFRRTAREQLAPLADRSFVAEGEGGVFEVVGRRAGLDELLEAWVEVTRGYERFYMDPVGASALEDGRIFVPLLITARPPGGGDERLQAGAVFTLRDGVVTRLQFFGDRERALEVAGLA